LCLLVIRQFSGQDVLHAPFALVVACLSFDLEAFVAMPSAPMSAHLPLVFMAVLGTSALGIVAGVRGLTNLFGVPVGRVARAAASRETVARKRSLQGAESACGLRADRVASSDGLFHTPDISTNFLGL
jgi:hypothetical protein